MMFSICFLVLENACVRQVFNLGVALIASCAGRLSWLTAAPGENFRGFLKEIRDGKIGRPRESRSTLGQPSASTRPAGAPDGSGGWPANRPSGRGRRGAAAG
ncbi:hypothetical protein, partial [Burkholderia ubonensis]|uniref:hypothetical protein n=1 Tax=Burkholderia ubonensis TaxID=101571 RepID=UPI001C42E960